MEGVSYRPLIEDMTWSYSRIKCFSDCPYRFFLKYIKKIDDIPQFYSSYGSFMHKLLEQYYHGFLTKEDMQIKFLLDFQKEVQGKRPKEETVRKYIQAGTEYLKSFKPFPYKMVDVERKISFEISGIPFIGIIDYIGEKNGELYIVDNKSRDLKPRSQKKKPTLNDLELDEMLKQLYIYSEGVKQVYGEYPKALCFNCFKNNTFIEEPFIKDEHDNTMQWALQSIKEIKDTTEFYPMMEYFGCSYICGVNDECIFYEMR